MSGLPQDDAYTNKLNSALVQITRTPALTSGVLKDAAEVIAREGCLALGVTRVGIWLVDHQNKVLKSVACYAMPEGRLTVQEDFPLDERPYYIELLSTQRLIVINDSLTDDVLPNLQETYGSEIRSLLDAPVRVGGELVAVVCMEQAHIQRNWSAQEQAFSSSLADFTALALESAERRQAMEDLALS